MMLLDSYERRARLTPGLFVAAPIAFTLVVLGLRENPVAATGAALLSAIGGPFVLASIVRDRGLALQVDLFARWGGPPTRRFLQTTNVERSAVQRDAWRADVERASGTRLPTTKQEAAGDAESAATYDVAVGRLRAKTRDNKRFHLVFEENRNYGFWRNLLAMRPFGVAVASLCLVVVISATVAATTTNVLASTPHSTFALGVVLSIVLIAFWLLVPRQDAVKRASERYAEQLLSAAADVA